jgi:hypothetical protein
MGAFAVKGEFLTEDFSHAKPRSREEREGRKFDGFAGLHMRKILR